MSKSECTAEMESVAVPHHTHQCSGEHDIIDGSHWCAGCKRWFWTRPSDSLART